MNTAQLASLIIDVQEPFDTDEMISLSATPDNVLIRSYYCDPHTGVSLLQEYRDSELDSLFNVCKSLPEATATVAKLYGSKPLSTEERDYVRQRVLRETIDVIREIGGRRRLDGFPVATLDGVAVSVVNEIKAFISPFKN